MTSRYLDMVRGSRHGSGGFKFTAKTLLMILAFFATIGSGVYWWGIQSILTPNKFIAASFTMIMVLGPPSLVSFLIPWSPAGMLLAKINARTWGGMVVALCSCVLVWYSFNMQYQWWSVQPVVADSDIVLQQVLVGLIGFIFIPALLWTPVTSEELTEQIRQAHLVRRYELQTQADIAILRNTLLRAQEKALIGFANLTVQEKEELASVMRGLVRGIDSTMKELSASVRTVSGTLLPFQSLEDNEDIRGYLDYVADSLVETGFAPPQQKNQNQSGTSNLPGSKQNQNQNAMQRKNTYGAD